MFQGLDVEAECWRDGVNVFAIDSLQDSCLASIIETKHQQANFLFLLAVLFEDGKKTHLCMLCKKMKLEGLEKRWMLLFNVRMEDVWMLVLSVEMLRGQVDAEETLGGHCEREHHFKGFEVTAFSSDLRDAPLKTAAHKCVFVRKVCAALLSGEQKDHTVNP